MRCVHFLGLFVFWFTYGFVLIVRPSWLVRPLLKTPRAVQWLFFHKVKSLGLDPGSDAGEMFYRALGIAALGFSLLNLGEFISWNLR